MKRWPTQLTSPCFSDRGDFFGLEKLAGDSKTIKIPACDAPNVGDLLRSCEPVDVGADSVAASALGAARIGDGRSTLQDGTLSAVNQAAYRLGLRVGRPALALAHAVADKE